MRTLCIVGLGMIGGSLAGALKKAGYQGRITALVRSADTGKRGVDLGFIDSFSTEPANVVADADIIMLAVPMLSMYAQMVAIKPYLKAQSVVTDAGSVKGPFIKDAMSALGSLQRVVPGHPIAGREKTGVNAADVNLYNGRRVLLTPTEGVDVQAIEWVKLLWQMVGAEVELLAPEQHDRVLAATSHLPHVLAFALVDTLATQQEAEEIFRYAAGGFRDFSRIASSDAVMWRDVCLTNRDAILESMDRLDVHVKQLRTMIELEDGAGIQAVFERAKNARDKYTD